MEDMKKEKKSKKKPKKEVKKIEESGEIKTEEVCNVFEVEKSGEESRKFSTPFKLGKFEGKKNKEVFHLSKLGKFEGKEKIVESCGDVEEKPASEKQVKEQNKILRNILIGIGIFVLFFVIGFYFTNSVKNFEYNNIKFDIIKEKKINFYHTSFPMTYKSGEKAIYNVFLRKDPRKIGEIPFEGELYLSEMLVLNSSENFNCDGNGVVAIANFQQILNALGTNVINDPKANCDEYGRYIFINLQKGNKTEIKNIGKKCYNFNINKCEVLDVTERFLLEALKSVNN